ncbi:hypothetical protein C2S52_014009 [Perilla frutescens var. hirtella]|nr:hypothetical protein C2S52_014009 [Perilla frutescens var. hirtella]
MSQASILYDEIWTPEMEAQFIEEALQEQAAGRWMRKLFVGDYVGFFIQHVSSVLNQEFAWQLSIDYYDNRLSFLFTRFNNFTFIIGHDEVKWDRQSNATTMCECVYNWLLETKGEPHYSSQEKLFDLNPADDADLHEMPIKVNSDSESSD